ncbi:N,N-dimethylformamidase beta subunit family domain-containing protein, partial [Frankia sp. Cr1]|uniref:N,N-dimethylformamidase beta subunit family domain-containing protein n=1 Tax=Frankia sp. Cr1 TaxID=3073931 RepID=UPI002AD40E99
MSISSREDPLSSLLTVRRGGGYRQLVSPLSSRLIVLSVAVAMLMALSVPLASRAHAADPCGPPVVNPIACENTKTGSPQSEWDTTGTGDDTIQGFSTDISVNAGSTVHFKIKTSASAYRIDIYRLGWYGGDGARKMATVNHSGVQSQPACLFYTATNLTDCGNWAESTSWAVPGSAVSGVYVAKLTRTDTNADNHIVFVVRNDTSHSDVLYQTSDTTWQAYNSFGGASLYPGPIGRAYKVSYNRPFTTRGDVPEGRDFVFANEYPMIRFLERNGYDVSYASGVDTDRYGSLLTNHKTFLSVGHDEYWSGQQRANVEAARDAGVNLAFFSGNEVYWKTRWEPSTEGSSTPY